MLDLWDIYISTIVGVEKMIIHTDLKDKSNSIMKIIHSPGPEPRNLGQST